MQWTEQVSRQQPGLSAGTTTQYNGLGALPADLCVSLFWGLDTQDQGAGKATLTLRPLLLACSSHTSLCPYVGEGGEREMDRELVSQKGTDPIISGSHPHDII